MLRVVALRPRPSPLFEHAVPSGAISAVAGGDLTGDGVDDAVFAVGARDGAATELFLLTGDPREGT